MLVKFDTNIEIIKAHDNYMLKFVFEPIVQNVVDLKQIAELNSDKILNQIY
jgi:fructose-1,6-bisphosphatase/sedoheptulose 1,7-bisphosphatase-like protein